MRGALAHHGPHGFAGETANPGALVNRRGDIKGDGRQSDSLQNAFDCFFGRGGGCACDTAKGDQTIDDEIPRHDDDGGDGFGNVQAQKCAATI